MNRHEPFEELISASLTGDLTQIERQRLDAHLDSCAACRATLATFADQRRIMAGLRHVPPPRDLGARVRSAIETGRFAPLPWWRRPAVVFVGVGGGLATVTGVLLALVLLNGSPEGPSVGAASPSTSATLATAPALPSASALPTLPTLPPVATLAPNASPAESVAPSPSIEAEPTTTPIPASPEPDVYLALTGPVESPKLAVLDGPTGDDVAQVSERASGPPIAAELSPDGQFLAYITQMGQSGMNEVRVTRIAERSEPAGPSDPPEVNSPLAVGETALLGETIGGRPFLDRLAWSPDGAHLAYTLADPDDAGATDVWLFGPEAAESSQLTDVGNAYAASWIPDDDTLRLWVSLAAAQPMSYVLSLPADDEITAVDPAEAGTHETRGVFVPILSPNGSLAIYWTGRMEVADESGWVIAEGGAPYLAEHEIRRGTYEFRSDRPLFSDLTIDRDSFTYAAISWGADGDAYAVWDARWAGVSQGDAGTDYPDPSRVYFGHASDRRGLTQHHAIDPDDLADDAVVVDVKVSPTGRHLVITALRPVGGIGEAPKADLLLITRNTGDVPDIVEPIHSAEDGGWFGPAAFDSLTGTAAGD